MFNMGLSELLVLAVLALVFIGPKQLPEVARMLGRLINEWKRATSDFTESFTGGSDLKNEIHKAIYSMPEPKKEGPRGEEESGEQLSLAIPEDDDVSDPHFEADEVVEVAPQVTDPILAPRPAAPNTKPRVTRSNDDSGDIS